MSALLESSRRPLLAHRSGGLRRDDDTAEAPVASQALRAASNGPAPLTAWFRAVLGLTQPLTSSPRCHINSCTTRGYMVTVSGTIIAVQVPPRHPARWRRPAEVAVVADRRGGIVTTYAEVQRAPFELHAPVLRISSHVDGATEDVRAFAEALAEATELLS
jgi:hypothetical protein